jgi:prepilin-type N-terminal cleavage/methylation domain-containing protein
MAIISGVRMRRAFTLVELLVVIAIIGVLVGLLLPAVQASREAGRRMMCQNNLKNQVLALHNFHDANNRFPPGNYAVDGLDHSWCTYVLPYLEQSNVYDRIDLRKSWRDPSGNYAVTRTVLPVFRCPSSPYDEPGDADYAGIIGSSATGANWDTAFRNGVFPAVEESGLNGVRCADITDGLSNTICIAESPDRTEAEHGNWADGMGAFHSSGVIDRALREICSWHPAGAMAARADGGVAFLARTTNAYVVGALCTRNGEEVVDLSGL